MMLINIKNKYKTKTIKKIIHYKFEKKYLKNSFLIGHHLN